jgi:hypothetical protein
MSDNSKIEWTDATWNPVRGWGKVPIVMHLFDKDPKKIESLSSVVESTDWGIPGIQIDCRAMAFQDALAEHESILSDDKVIKALKAQGIIEADFRVPDVRRMDSPPLIRLNS